VISYCFLAFLISEGAVAQVDNKPFGNEFSYEVSYYQGILFKIYDVFPENKSASAIDFSFGILTKGGKYWQQKYNYPGMKLTFSYSDYGNVRILGNSLSIYPSIGNAKAIDQTTFLDYYAGFGLAYFNKPFDEFNNPTNNVIGSNIVAVVAGKLVMEKTFSDKMSINLGGSFRHYSDGHVKVPNVGANLIYLTTGIKYMPSNSKLLDVIPDKEINSKLSFKTDFGLGIHEVEGTVYPYGGPIYYVYNGNFSIAKRTSFKHQFSIGINYNYYTDYYDFIETQEVFYEKEKLRSSKVILFLGHEWMFNHLSVELKVGANLYYPFRYKLIEMEILESRFMDNYLSGQFGFNYYLFDSFSDKKVNPYTGVSIRTIGGKADFIQLIIGVNI
jgi:hypothetical protein